MNNNEALHEAIFRLGRLNLSGVIPEMCHAEIVIMKTIASCEEKNENPQKGVKVSAIVNELCIAPPAVSRTMNSLEEKGFIERTVNKSDRRNTLVSLTEEGWKKHYDIRRRVDAFMSRIFSRVGEEKVQAVVESINEIYDAARTELALLKKERANK